ncbi:pyridoxal-phosphate dependent enzyme [bacterium SCSIO 12696]|nr:pyridoxal-phosphate dependent enzyme [bacterium SCSIO 12696]
MTNLPCSELGLATPIERVRVGVLAEKDIQLIIKREDLRHPQISGNKFHKLKYNLDYAKREGFSAVASFGGAWSNHLHALAYAGKQQGLNTIGFIRGPLPQPLNAMLKDAQSWGMDLRPLSYGDYRRRYEDDFCQELMASVTNGYLIPEGGAGQLAVRGCAELGAEIVAQTPGMDYLCVACGTGATMAGLIAGVKGRATVLGFSVIKNNHKLQSDIRSWLPEHCLQKPWRIIEGYDCGGFGKLSQQLVAFMDQWHSHSSIPLEPLYTGKMLYGLFHLIDADYFPPASKVVVLHSGGLQGLRGMESEMEKYRS